MLIPVNLMLLYLPNNADTCQFNTVIPASSLPALWDTEEPPLLEHELEASEEKQEEKEWFRDEDGATSSNRGKGT